MGVFGNNIIICRGYYKLVNRDLKVILIKFIDGFLSIFGNVLNNFLGISISYFCLVFLITTNIGQVSILGFFILVYIGFIYVRIKNMIKRRESED